MTLFDQVKYRKITACASCDSHEYTLPIPVTQDIEHYLKYLGPLKYPLDKVSIIKIETQSVKLQGRVGSPTLKIKFIKEPQARDMFEIQLGAYLGAMMGEGK